MSIFLQIVSYRDDEIVPTVISAISQADNPSNITIAIIIQDCPSALSEYNDWLNVIDLKGSSLKVEYVNYLNAQGMCWARSKAQSYFNDEDYVFQIDSHSRFTKSWDTDLVEMLKKLPEKALISAYPASYQPVNKLTSHFQYAVGANAFESDGILRLYAARPNGDSQLGLGVSGGFIFTTGDWLENVPSDPFQFFGVDEVALSVRSWTHGYDIYTPNKTVLYHYYGREKYPRQWDEDPNWKEFDSVSRERYWKLLSGEEGLGVYGLGTVREIEDYEKFSGIDFTDKILTANARLGYPKDIGEEINNNSVPYEMFRYVKSTTPS